MGETRQNAQLKSKHLKYMIFWFFFLHVVQEKLLQSFFLFSLYLIFPLTAAYVLLISERTAFIAFLGKTLYRVSEVDGRIILWYLFIQGTNHFMVFTAPLLVGVRARLLDDPRENPVN